MKGKIVGLTVILLLVLSIIATGIGAVAQGGSMALPNGGGAALAQAPAADAAAGDGEESALYSAFTYVCPFH